MEKMLEDALLMISYHVTKNAQITEMVNQNLNEKQETRIELYKDFEKEELTQLYDLNKKISSPYKLVINVFEGSYILRQLKVLEEYGMEVEVTLPVYSRTFSVLSNQMIINGSLDKK